MGRVGGLALLCRRLPGQASTSAGWPALVSPPALASLPAESPSGRRGLFGAAKLRDAAAGRLALRPPSRGFFGLPKLPSPFPSSESGGAAPNRNRKSYAERRRLGFSAEEMWDIVADVGRYEEFVPWCTGSRVLGPKEAELSIGFPPLSESYVSRLTLERPRVVRSETRRSGLFRSLVSEWRFSEAAEKACTLDYTVSFEFRSALHAHLAHAFFDDVLKTVVQAFLRRAEELHGKPSLSQHQMRPHVRAYKA